MRETLALMNIDEARFVQFNSRDPRIVSSVATDRITYMSSCGPSFCHALNGGDPVFLDAILSALAPSKVTDAINLVVNQKGTRKLFFESAARSLLDAFGFTEFSLEDLTFDQQRHVFSAADSVISAHGARLANLVFCKPRTGLDHKTAHPTLPPRAACA